MCAIFPYSLGLNITDKKNKINGGGVGSGCRIGV